MPTRERLNSLRVRRGESTDKPRATVRGAVDPTRPVLAAVVSLVSTGVLILVVPFFQAGILGMASEAIRGKTSLSTLIAAGKTSYVPLLLAYFVLLAVTVVFAFVVIFAVFIVVIGVSVGGAGSSSSGSGAGESGVGEGGIVGGTDVASGVAGGGDVTLLAVIGVVAGGLALAYFLVTFFIQFYSHAIVLDDTSLVDGFRRSVGLVRSNLLGVLGYSLVLLVGGVVFGTIGAVGGIVSAAWGSASPELPASPLADLVAGVEPTFGIVVAFAAVYVVSTGVSARSTPRIRWRSTSRDGPIRFPKRPQRGWRRQRTRPRRQRTRPRRPRVRTEGVAPVRPRRPPPPPPLIRQQPFGRYEHAGRRSLRRGGGRIGGSRVRGGR